MPPFICLRSQEKDLADDCIKPEFRRTKIIIIIVITVFGLSIMLKIWHEKSHVSCTSQISKLYQQNVNIKSLISMIKINEWYRTSKLSCLDVIDNTKKTRFIIKTVIWLTFTAPMIRDVLIFTLFIL